MHNMKQFVFAIVTIVLLQVDAAGANNELWQQPSVPSFPETPSLGEVGVVPQLGQDESFQVPAITSEVTESTKIVNTGLGLKIGGDVIERSVSAVVMLGIVTLVVRQFGQRGIVGFILVCQSVMYNESCHLLENAKEHVDPLNISPIIPVKLQQVWWFLTAQTATSLRYLKTFNDDYLCKLVAFGMAAISLAVGVLTMAQQGSNDSTFRNYMAKVTSSHFALLFLVAQSAAWILTLQEFGTAWFLLPALLVIVNDTMAYVFGRLIGKHKLIPNLSPKKTWEGFIGAAISTILIAPSLLNLLKIDIGAKEHALVIAAYVSIISPFGGFLASAVKRAYGAKDFGSFLPGHGGAIDRLDCQVVTAPFVYLYLKFSFAKASY